MKCDEIKTLLNPYVDNELTQADTEQVKKHLAECPACAKETAELIKVKEMLRGLPELTAPAGLLEGVRGNLARPNPETLQRNSTFLRYRWLTLSLASAAAVILVAFTIMIQFRKSNMQTPAPAGQPDYSFNEKSTANFAASVMPKTEVLDAIQAQPMFFTQQINISARDVNGTLDKVYYVALLDTAVKNVENEKKAGGAENKNNAPGAVLGPKEKDLLVKAQNQQQTMSNVEIPFRSRTQVEPSFIQRREDNKRQTVKITVPLSQKEKFIRNLKDSISDKMVMSKIQVIPQDRLADDYLANAGKNILETGDRQKGNEPSDQGARSYDAIGKGGGKGADSKQAEVNKIEGGRSGAAKADEAKDKSAPQPKPSPKATTAMPPPPPPAAPAPSAPSTKFGKSPAKEKEETNQDKDLKKQSDVEDTTNAVSQTAQTQTSTALSPELWNGAGQPEPMIEITIVIEPIEK